MGFEPVLSFGRPDLPDYHYGRGTVPDRARRDNVAARFGTGRRRGDEGSRV